MDAMGFGVSCSLPLILVEGMKAKEKKVKKKKNVKEAGEGGTYKYSVDLLYPGTLKMFKEKVLELHLGVGNYLEAKWRGGPVRRGGQQVREGEAEASCHCAAEIEKVSPGSYCSLLPS
eukprot:Sspe_Gene.74197::Locus_45706_Transcript_1_1_Confidence_1.000_Length_454::g.74197::m.74197